MLIKVRLAFVVCFLTCFFISITAFSQAPDKVVADEVQVINGKKYTVHIVSKKETMYSLSKKYNCTIEEIQKANPIIGEKGLQLGQTILIGFKTGEKSAEVKAASVQKDNTSKPSESIKATVVKPAEKSADAKPAAVAQDKMSKSAEGVNPGVKTPEKTADVKPLPATPLLYTKSKKGSMKDSVTVPAKKIVKDTAVKATWMDTLKKVNPNPENAQYKIALFLPLNLSTESNTKNAEDGNSAEVISSSALIGAEFYEGFKMAADSLAKEGLKAHLYVYDSAGDTNRINKLLLKPELKSTNLIIGPLFPVNSFRFAKFSKDNGIVMVSPLSNADKLLKENPFAINGMPSVKTQCLKMSEFLVDSFPSANILILTANSAKEIELANNFKQSVTNLLKARGNITTTLKVINHADIGVKTVKESLSTSAKNVIIIPSSEEAFISVILSNLKGLLSDYNITVCGLPTWQKFETVDADIFQDLNTHIFNAYYVNHNSEPIQKFRKQYKALYKTEPSEYVYHGFDAGYYYLKALMSFGPGFIEVLPELKFQVMHTNFDFERVGVKGGYENKYVSILKYADFQLWKLNK